MNDKNRSDQKATVSGRDGKNTTVGPAARIELLQIITRNILLFIETRLELHSISIYSNQTILHRGLWTRWTFFSLSSSTPPRPHLITSESPS